MMKKSAFAVLLVAAGGLAACGGDDDDVVIVDSAPQADAGVAMQCNPVTQEGCGENEKCAQLIISADPFLARTDCVPNGTAAVGEACDVGDPGEETGFDNCASSADLGGQCINGICRQICTSPADTCGDAFSCTFFENLYDDLEEQQVGVCNQVCNPVTQDCVIEGEACYLDPRDAEGEATCVGLVDQAMGLVQDMECYGPDDATCYLNGCDAGYHPVIIDIPPTGGKSLCTAYCQPVDTYLVDPDGTFDPTDPMDDHVVVDGGNVTGFDDADPKTPAVDCSADRIGVIDHQCRFFQPIGDGAGGDLGYIPAEYGFCLDSGPDANANTEFYGDCARTSYERQFKAFDEGYPDATTVGDDARQAWCTDNPATCGAFCTSNATFDAIADAYCTANAESPICAPAASGRRESMQKVYAGRGLATVRHVAQ
ncbi:MAG TPA: hypothetical protein VKB80_35915 [Kofleriaceae bacterium]|nr:hypothetical protein [Kofleriaceae bacterium]